MLHIPTDEDENQTQSLLFRHSCKVVEYLEPIMSKELLIKFPDNSAFDFDYSQSSIWSPLIPRTHSPMDLDMSLVTPRKLTFGFGFESADQSKSGSKRMMSSMNKKMNTSKVKVNFSVMKMKLQKKKKKVAASEFSAVPMKGCLPFNTKGWNKVLKAASKHFKRRKKNDSTTHAKLSNYVRDVTNSSLPFQ